MAKRTIIFWRDIPSQVVVKQGRTSAKKQLTKRFMVPQTIVETTAEELEARFSDDVLKALIKNKGLNPTDT